MSQEDQNPRSGEPDPRRDPDARQRPEPTAGERNPWRYVRAVYQLNHGLPHVVDFPEALT